MNSSTKYIGVIFYNAIDCPSKEFFSVLGYNDNRFAVIYRRGDKYYVEQDNYEFFPTFWCELPAFE